MMTPSTRTKRAPLLAAVAVAGMLVLLAGPSSAGTAARGSVSSGTCTATDDSVCSGSGVAADESTSSGGASDAEEPVGSGRTPPKPTGPSVYFTLPSGNIGCVMQSDGVVRCDIRQRDWAPPARPADCNPNYDFGQGLVLGATARFVCATDTALIGAPVLPSGSTSRQGPYQCRSDENGVECINLDTGHGFLLSAADYRIF